MLTLSTLVILNTISDTPPTGMRSLPVVNSSTCFCRSTDISVTTFQKFLAHKQQQNHRRRRRRHRRHRFRQRCGEEREPSKNEPNQNPGFAKNRTEPEPESKKNVQEPKPNQTPTPVKNRTEREPKYHGSYSVLSLNEVHSHISQ